MNYWQVKDLPMRVFWFMNSQINRILAEKDLRQIKVAMNAQSGEAAAGMQESLLIEMGEVVQMNPLAAEPDKRGLEGLRNLGKTR